MRLDPNCRFIEHRSLYWFSTFQLSHTVYLFLAMTTVKYYLQYEKYRIPYAYNSIEVLLYILLTDKIDPSYYLVHGLSFRLVTYFHVIELMKHMSLPRHNLV